MGKATASVVEVVVKQQLIDRSSVLPVNIHRRGILVTYRLQFLRATRVAQGLFMYYLPCLLVDSLPRYAYTLSF